MIFILFFQYLVNSGLGEYVGGVGVGVGVGVVVIVAGVVAVVLT